MSSEIASVLKVCFVSGTKGLKFKYNHVKKGV